MATSAHARLRHPEVPQRLGPLVEAGLVATCTLMDLEILFSSRTAIEHEQVRQERAGWERLDIEQAHWDRAERHRVTLLHYDRDFEFIVDVTSQPAEWVVPPGSVV